MDYWNRQIWDTLENKHTLYYFIVTSYIHHNVTEMANELLQVGLITTEQTDNTVLLNWLHMY
jgi:hypothetical protein